MASSTGPTSRLLLRWADELTRCLWAWPLEIDHLSLSFQNIVPKEDAEKNSRLKIVRKRLEQNFQKYFWDLCEVGDANKDGNIDVDEWLDVMNDIVGQVRNNNTFPEWYEGLHKAVFRSEELYSKSLTFYFITQLLITPFTLV